MKSFCTEKVVVAGPPPRARRKVYVCLQLELMMIVQDTSFTIFYYIIIANF